MRIPFEWLKEFVNLDVTAKEAAHKLTMLGFEVEAAEIVDNDVVFDVNVTPNRADCLSLIGIARELSAAYKIPLHYPEHDILAESGELDFNVDILDTDLCHRYAGRVVRNLKIGASPDWLRERLEKCGIRSINNVVDITNYVLIEFGHPLHAFDISSIKGHIIRVGTPEDLAVHDIRIKTIDSVEREAPDTCLLIWDAEKPIAIAGIMGGINTEVNDQTVDVFIESAYFDPVSVRRSSKSLGLKTESSYRFERGADIKALKKALDRAALLMKEIAGGAIYGKIDIYPKRLTQLEIEAKFANINRVLGIELTGEEIFDCLKGLGCEIDKLNDGLKIRPSTNRRDLQRESDIIEEVARHYGYDKIPAELPKATIGISLREDRVQHPVINIKNKLKGSLLKSGFSEVINYSFMGMEDIDLLGIQRDDKRRNALKIKNPLRIEDSYMRTSIIPSLIKNLQHNISHGNREFRLFEISKVFTAKAGLGYKLKTASSSDLLPIEKEHLAAIYYKEKAKSLYKEDAADFYVMKGVIEAIFRDFKIYEYSFMRSSESFLHPGQSADIFINGQNELKIGYIGALSPLIIEALNIKAHKPSVLVMELDIEKIIPFTERCVKYMPLPKYPYIERDTAVMVDISLDASSIITCLKSYPSDLIEESNIFDVYYGPNMPEGKKSVAFNVRYRAMDRTLKDEEIDEVHNSLVEYMLAKTNGVLRQ